MLATGFQPKDKDKDKINSNIFPFSIQKGNSVLIA
uniref:Uncharacterized protein n=1 Tax=Rhizophora mucronata TaxID=61149 RepID=A0A2P2J181_RHIMU